MNNTLGTTAPLFNFETENYGEFSPIGVERNIVNGVAYHYYCISRHLSHNPKDSPGKTCSPPQTRGKTKAGTSSREIVAEIQPEKLAAFLRPFTFPLHILAYSKKIHRLKFSLHCCDGGEFNDSYKAENILVPDKTVYCSRKSSNVNLLFKYSPDIVSAPNRESKIIRENSCLFNVTHVLIRAPNRGYTAPVKEGLVFIFHELPDLTKTDAFNDFNKKKYDNWLLNRSLNAAPLSDYDPKSYFRIEMGKHSAVVAFDYPHSGRWIMLKLIRSSCSLSNYFATEPIAPPRVRGLREFGVFNPRNIFSRSRLEDLAAFRQNPGSALLDMISSTRGLTQVHSSASPFPHHRPRNSPHQNQPSSVEPRDEVADWDADEHFEQNIDVEYCGFAGFVGTVGLAQADIN